MPATDGQSPPQSAIGGHSRTESDTVGQLFTLDVHQTQALFDAANLPRSLRSITRYCQTNRLDAVTVDGPNGPEWRISEASVTRAIDELKRVFSMSDTASHLQTRFAQIGTPFRPMPTADAIRFIEADQKLWWPIVKGAAAK